MKSGLLIYKVTGPSGYLSNSTSSQEEICIDLTFLKKLHLEMKKGFRSLVSHSLL